MTTPRTALTSDDIPPGPLSEDDLRRGWNQQADEHNQWESLDSCEQLAWAQVRAIAADRARAALKVELDAEKPSEKNLYDLAAEFDGDPVPAMRRALELWGNPLRGAPAPGANLAAVPREADMDHVEQLAAIIRKVDGNHSMGAAALAEAILERYPLAFLVDPPAAAPAPGGNLATPPAPEPGEVGELVDVGELVAYLQDHGRWLIQSSYANESIDTRDLGIRVFRAATLLQRQAAELDALRDAPHPTFQDAIRLAEGCHDYSGGHSGTEGKAWHRAIDMVVAVLKRAAVGPWDSQLKAVYGVGVAAGAGEVEASGRRPEGDWVDGLQHAAESKEHDFLGGVCVALALVTVYDEATLWRQIVRSVGTESLLNYAANVNPEDWQLAGFGKYAQAELGKGKPLPAPQAGEVEA